MSKHRVFILGLDGATPVLVQRWMDEGRLPHLHAMAHGGAWGELRSTVHPFSAQAWSTFMTGANPGRHGLFDFTEPSEGQYGFRFVDASARKLPSLWRLLSDEGKKVVVINVPMTYPPEPVNGVMISGMDAPGCASPFVWPPEEKDRLLQNHPDYEIELSVRDFVRRGQSSAFLPALKEAVSVQVSALKQYLSEIDWDVAIWVCRAPDQAQHFFWRHMDEGHPCHNPNASKAEQGAVGEVYEWMDLVTGDLREFVGEETDFVVMSDHGAGGTSDKALMLNKWLASHGLLTFDDSKRGPAARLLDFGPTRKLYQARKALPRSMKNALINRVPGVRDKIETVMALDGINWSKTVAYSEETRANIRINLKGREPEGIVDPADYQGLRERIIALLEGLKDPDTGRPMARDIYRREDLYDGPFVERAPDILFSQAEGDYFHMLRRSRGLSGSAAFRRLTREELEEDAWPNGSHRLTGLLFAHGPSFRAGSAPNRAGLEDLAPTLLSILGLAPTADMDGRRLSEILEEGEASEEREMIAASATATREKYSVNEIQQIEDRLRGLGYIE